MSSHISTYSNSYIPVPLLSCRFPFDPSSPPHHITPYGAHLPSWTTISPLDTEARSNHLLPLSLELFNTYLFYLSLDILSTAAFYCYPLGLFIHSHTFQDYSTSRPNSVSLSRTSLSSLTSLFAIRLGDLVPGFALPCLQIS